MTDFRSEVKNGRSIRMDDAEPRGFQRLIRKQIPIFVGAILLVAGCICGSLVGIAIAPEGTADVADVTEIVAVTQVAQIQETYTPYPTYTPQKPIIVTATFTPSPVFTPTITPTPTVTPTPTITPTITPTPDSRTESRGNGFYLVNVDIMPGIWRSTPGLDDCYWARYDSSNDILGNHFGLSGGTVRLYQSDFLVEFNDCGTWEYIGP